METAKPALANTAGDGVRHGACGLLGGEDGATHAYTLASKDRPHRVLRTKETGIEIRPGDVLQVRSGGGGGWGPPERRSATARDRDQREGLVESANPDLTAGVGARP